MQNVITLIQLISATILIVLITIQAKGVGLSTSGSSGVAFSRRGVEKVVFRFTFIIAVLFIAVSLFDIFF